jgi:hypothetical protein
MLKFIAVLSMVVDHVGYAIYPDYHVLRVIGRIAFPLFAFSVGSGVHRTTDLNKYAWRLYFCAMVSQIPYGLLFHWRGLDVVWSFLFAVLVFKDHMDWNTPGYRPALLFICFSLLSEFLHVDYGFYGMVLTLLFMLCADALWMCALFLLTMTVLQCLYVGSWLQLWCLLSLPFIYLYRDGDFQWLPRRFFYYFYPVHMFLIYILGVL